MDKREKQIAKKMRAAGKSASDEEREKRDRRAKHERQLERSKYKKIAKSYLDSEPDVKGINDKFATQSQLLPEERIRTEVSGLVTFDEWQLKKQAAEEAAKAEQEGADRKRKSSASGDEPNAKRRKAKKVTSKLSFSFDDGDEADEEA